MEDVRDHCTLTDEQFEARRKTIRTGLLSRVERREDRPDGIALYFEDSDGQRAELQAFVDFERECCAGLDFEVVETDEGLRLEIRGIDAAAIGFEVSGTTPAKPTEHEGGCGC